MELFINQNNGKLEKMNSETIPLNITTDIFLYKKINTSIEQCRYINGEKLYIENNGNLTTDQMVFESTSIIDKNDIDNVENLNNNFYYSTCLRNIDYTEQAGIYERTQLTENNIELFTLHEILEKEFENIVNNSEYDSVLYDILSDIKITQSKFRSINNNIYVILNKADNIIIEMDLPDPIKELKLNNICDRITVFINDKKIDSDTCLVNNMKKLKIELVNNSDSVVSIINPYILYK